MFSYEVARELYSIVEDNPDLDEADLVKVMTDAMSNRMETVKNGVGDYFSRFNPRNPSDRNAYKQLLAGFKAFMTSEFG